MINVAAGPLAIQIHFLLLMMLPLGFERASQQVSSHAVRMSKQSQLATDQNQIHCRVYLLIPIPALLSRPRTVILDRSSNYLGGRRSVYLSRILLELGSFAYERL